MKKLFLSLVIVFYGAAQANDLNNLNQYGEPAMIELAAATAEVTTINGKTTLTLNDVDRLAGIVASIHKTKRMMNAFPVSEFSTAWNSCNVMKDQKKLWNTDGLNSVLIFHYGPDSNPQNVHLAKAPLVTAPIDTTQTLGGDEGAAKLMLINAEMSKNSLSFDIEKGSIAPGTYQRVRLMTECITA